MFAQREYGLLALALAAPAQAARRVVLMIGSSVYAHAPRLANPLNDADDIGVALGRLGFAVTRLENASKVAVFVHARCSMRTRRCAS